MVVEPLPLSTTVTARSIYGDEPHYVEPLGLTVEPLVRKELARFLREFIAFTGINGENYFRLDLYFDAFRMYVIEVNVESADGWGVGLNLLRAAGRTLGSELTQCFPTDFPTFPGDLRRTEFELACTEFAIYGHRACINTHSARYIDPYDDKIHLARFAPHWRSEYVRIPLLYSQEICPWEQVPQDVYLKFREKFDPEAVKSRFSVKPRSELGRAKRMRELYTEGRAIAQERITPYRLADGRGVQAVVMCAGSTPVTGYIQIAPQEREASSTTRAPRKDPSCFSHEARGRVCENTSHTHLAFLTLHTPLYERNYYF